MPGVVGADVDELRALSRRTADAAERLRRVMTQTTNRLNSARWLGPDAERYRAQWQGESMPYLRAAADALQDAATTLQRNADEQQQASAAGISHEGLFAGLFTPDPGRPGWGWPGQWGNSDPGMTPWFLHPGGGLPDPGMTPGFLRPGDGLPDPGMTPDWAFPNPFDQFQDFTGKTPIWPIIGDTALDTGSAGGGMPYAGGTAPAFDDRLAQEISKADLSPTAGQHNIDYIASNPGDAFRIASDAIVGHIGKLVSNFSFNPLGK